MYHPLLPLLKIGQIQELNQMNQTLRLKAPPQDLVLRVVTPSKQIEEVHKKIINFSFYFFTLIRYFRSFLFLVHKRFIIYIGYFVPKYLKL